MLRRSRSLFLCSGPVAAYLPVALPGSGAGLKIEAAKYGIFAVALLYGDQGFLKPVLPERIRENVSV